MATSKNADTLQSRAQKIIEDERQTFAKLAELEHALNQAFSDMEEAVYALVLSLLTGEPLLFVGPPGTGKSMLIHTLCHHLGLYNLENPSEAHEGFYEYLLTPFTEPTELFGHYDIRAAFSSTQPLKRLEENMMRKAKVVYLDEVFNGSSAILNSILAFINERVVHDRGQREPALWEFFFAATNRRPEATELQAIYDRFVLRCWVDNVSVVATNSAHAAVDNLRGLVTAGWNQTYGRPVAKGGYAHLRTSLPRLRVRIKAITHADGVKPATELMGPGFIETLAVVVENARDFDLSQMSNRRIIKLIYVLFAHRLYQAAQQKKDRYLLLPQDLELVGRYFLDNVQDEQGVQALQRLVLVHSQG